MKIYNNIVINLLANFEILFVWVEYIKKKCSYIYPVLFQQFAVKNGGILLCEQPPPVLVVELLL